MPGEAAGSALWNAFWNTDRVVTPPSRQTAQTTSDPALALNATASPRVPRLALSVDEAAEALGVSRDFFEEHIRWELRVVRRGRRILVPVVELQRWLEANSSRVLDGRR